MFTESDAYTLISQQEKEWEDFAERLKQLSAVETKEFSINDYKVIAQFNPARAVSSGAKVDKKSIAERKCFLCEKNRPSIQQGIAITPKYTLLVNPFPILKNHFTIASNSHTKQEIYKKIEDLLEIAKLMPSHTIFYNGPQSGASAPDHMHFQAIGKKQLPFELEQKTHSHTLLSENRDGQMYTIEGIGRKCVAIKSKRVDMASSLFRQLYNQLPQKENEEPLMNVFANFEDGEYQIFVFTRKAHRPDYYYSKDDFWMISPGAIDMGGVLVLPRKEDFDRINETVIENVYKQVSM